MNIWISLLNDGAVGIFGSVLSASFCNTLNTRRNRWIFWGGMAVVLVLQALVYSIWDAEFLRKIYPLIIHLPLVLLLYGLNKRLSESVISVLIAYLCCQLRRWLSLLVVALVSGGSMLQDAVELTITLPLLLLLLKFVSPVIRQFVSYPKKLQCQFAVIPALYYVFDYGTMVYTDLLTSGTPVVVEFMPFVCCGAYLVFLAYHSAEEEKRMQLQQVQNSLNLQLKQSVHEISTLRESQELTRQYRHDLRHHLQYISACIENHQEEQAQKYISGICKEIEAQRVECYCENEAANLIFSSFVGRARNDGITMNISGALPAFLLIADSDLCVLLSNALENAIHASKPFAAEGKAASIDVQFYEKEGKIFLQITNPCKKEIPFEKGIPVSDQPGHGIGVQSICAIVERYKGVYSFQVKEERFILRLFL